MSDDSIFMMNVEQYLLHCDPDEKDSSKHWFIYLLKTYISSIHTKSKSYSLTNGYGSGDSFRKTNHKTMMFDEE